MGNKNDVHNIAPETVLDFLRHTLPFNELDDASLRQLAKHCIIDFIPKGTLIFRQGETEVEHFYLIQKGGVKIYLEDDQGEVTLKDFRGEGEYFGALPIIRNTRANLNVETVEDTFCFLFTKDAFRQLLDSSPRVSQYFLRSLSEKMINTAYAELRHHRVTPRTESALFLFSSQVGSSIKGEPKTIAANESVRRAAGRMAELQIGSLLVTNQAEEIIGIVTDKDLRTKVVAAGLDYQTPVEQIMTSPVQTIPAHAVCFDAMLRMMRRRIHHLAVEKQDKIVGMVTTHDIMLLQGTSPLYLFREILAQRTLAGLHPLARKVPSVVRTLIEEGAKANNITKMITVLNDHILERLLTLIIKELGPPPIPFCWLLMGSEGRSEQTFKTDQDNALIYAWPDNEQKAAEAEEYFKMLSEVAIDNLVKCGYPLCPGEMMASNPKWRMSAPDWRKCFDNWIMTPEPKEVMHSTIFFDFRPGYGNFSLADKLRHHLSATIPKQELFLYHLAQNALEARPPLSFFRNLIVEKDGEHRNTLDLKTKGLVPFVDFARLFALKHGITESNTLVRLQLLNEGGHLTDDMYKETVKAYEFLMQLRLVHQLYMMENDQEPNNHINPANLSDLEKQTLKESFEVVRRLQSHIKAEFRLSER
ncbi:putative nucleotidyltransferase substrate binding domain-containing protein [Desulfurivibrio alkaliphilus]|uniref:Putative CBS domain and cyclic nucleotide-regulated nucleotidyltransferase n=1 Tax=Desulfurivibrio alkaliphilus (strain DSM 19089 / UNIQEM U267 / AHT2) TaxID=589865 RepID=D6Z282_DESAT|nr:putative nucleotidyltransferase substrate binding domain-containing protein [Desulfurivibrio alkaliphilus]ADH85657.1 putative CBS domain and cyclic nucleotide-regulated nucleotidyltransferase [Desulfurivibrio alkaliphilus AHT 2]